MGARRYGWFGWLAALLLLTGTALARAPQDGEVADSSDPPANVLEARRQLRANGQDDAVLSVHAAVLIDADDLDVLREVLQSEDVAPILGVLRACQAANHDGLLPELLSLAASSSSPEIERVATSTLEHLAASNPDVLETLVDALARGDADDAELAVLVIVLGRSRNLRAVDPLIVELSGPRSDRANEALSALTGQRCPSGMPEELLEWWVGFWDRNQGVARDALLEHVLQDERRWMDLEIQRMREEVIQSRIMLMRQDIDRLTAALTDDYPAVRLEAATRLGKHLEPAKAASAAQPVLLDQLGYGVNAGRAVNGESAAHASTLEQDPEVRAAMLTALGALGRDDPVVRSVLLDELRGDPALARAAVAALSRVRDQPDVVTPLLDFLERSKADEETVVTVLGIVQSNKPAGALDDLEPWLGADHGPAVRAAAVRAMLASSETMAALDRIGPLVTIDESRDVRYALALGLGDCVRTLDEDDPARPRILELLAGLIDDRDNSVRAESAASLGATADAGALAILEQRARTETDPSVLLRILDALGELALLDGITIIGRVFGTAEVEQRATLEQAARRALGEIGKDRPVEDWLDMATMLQEVGAYPLAENCLREIPGRAGDTAADRDVKARAAGQLAVVLWQDDKVDEAWEELDRLHIGNAPYPTRTVRLDLLARTSEQLGFHGNAADYFLERLALLPEGDSTRDETRRNAARTLISAGRHDDALEHVQALLAIDGSDNELLYWLAKIQMVKARDEEAYVTLRRLLDRVPEEDELLRAEVTAMLQTLDPDMEPAPEPDSPTPAEDDSDS